MRIGKIHQVRLISGCIRSAPKRLCEIALKFNEKLQTFSSNSVIMILANMGTRDEPSKRRPFVQKYDIQTFCCSSLK